MMSKISSALNRIREKEATSVYITGSFLDNFLGSLTFAVYTIFLIKSGLSLFQLGLINFIFMISIMILEVPTGAIADILGRKRSVLISAIFAFVGFILYPLSRNIYNFALAEILIAFSSTFIYGAFEAWMVKTSQKQGFRGKVDLVFSQSNIWSKIAGITGGLIGAYLAVIDIAVPFYVGAFLCLILFFFLLIFMVDDSKPIIGLKIKEAIGSLKKVTVEATKYSLNHKVLLWVVLGDALMLMCFQPLNMYWGPRFNVMLSDKIYLMGWIWAGIASVSLLGGLVSNKLMKKNTNYSYILVVAVVVIAIMAGISSSSQIAALAISSFLLHEIGRGMSQPVQLAYINQCAEESKRATIFSFESMVGAFGSAVGLLIFGFIASKTSIETSWIIASILVLAAIPLYLKAGRQDKCVV
jgi:MFS family permease